MASVSALLKPACINVQLADSRAVAPSTSSGSANKFFFGSYNGLAKASPSLKCAPSQTHGKDRSIRLQVNARGTVKFSPGSGESKGKPRFGTLFFRPKQDDDEDEADEAPRSGLSLVLNQSVLSGLQFLGRGRQADSNVVFVAAASGQIGSRIVLELLHDGFQVRAGVPDIREAQKVAEFAAAYEIINSQEAKRLNVVEFDFEDAESAAKAIGNAGKVVVTVGPDELGPSQKVTPQDAALVVAAAALAKISNLVLVTQISNVTARTEGPGGFFAKLVSFFTGSGSSGSMTATELIDKVVETNLNYTIIQALETGDVPDTYGATSNVVLAPEGTGSTGKVSKLQVASVVSTALSNIATAENKVFEVYASPEAAATPVVDLLSQIGEDGRRAALSEARARAEAEEDARRVAEEAQLALETAARLEEEARKLAAEEARAAAAAEKARARADAVSSSVNELAENLKQVGGMIPTDKIRLPTFSFGGTAKAKAAAEEEEAPAETGNGASRGGFSLKGLTSRLSSPKKADEDEEKSPTPGFDFKGLASKIGTVTGGESKEAKPSRQPSPKAKAAPKPAPVAAAPKTSKKGGLFGQETVYMDGSDAGDF